MADTIASAQPTKGTEENRGISAEEKISVATQWQLMWWRFRKHKLAMVGTIVIALFYAIVVMADFLAYADPSVSEAQRSLLSPQPIHWFENGAFSPHVDAMVGKRDPITFKRVYAPDPDKKIPIAFFTPGFSYKFLGIIPTSRDGQVRYHVPQLCHAPGSLSILRREQPPRCWR
ncbi:MAG TPA: hypothetical protein VHS28_09725 [Chloroflexota bacterium]|nr:hypothetical protein [Chloroflexota bacterium]